MFCSSCGAQIGDNSKFCASCGAMIWAGTQKPMPQGNVTVTGKKKKTPFIILGAVALVVIAAVIITVVIRNRTRPYIDESMYNFHTKDEFNQMMQEYENEESPENKSIGGTMVENVINSYNGEGNEDDEEFQEKLKNSSSPWFKDPGEE